MATGRGSTLPSYGHPATHDTYPLTLKPAALACSATSAAASSDCAIDMLRFAREKDSVAATKTATSLGRLVMLGRARVKSCQPRRFGTRTERSLLDLFACLPGLTTPVLRLPSFSSARWRSSAVLAICL